MHLSDLMLLALLCLGVQANSPSPSFCSKVKSIVAKAGAQSAATAFCSSYIHIPLSTVTSTSTPITTTTTTATTTVQSADVTTTTTVQGPDGTTTSSVQSCPSPSPSKLKAKRNSKPKPKSKPGCLSTYSPGVPLSSACSCLSIPPSKTTVIKTAPTITSTATTTSTVNREGGTITSTSTIPGSTSISYVLAPPPCNQIYEPVDDADYSYYFAGCGVKENDNNPGGTQEGSLTYSAVSVCDATLQCADIASGDDDYSFALYHLTSGDWQCVVYLNANTDPAYFNVQDSGVLEAYGFSGTSDY